MRKNDDPASLIEGWIYLHPEGKSKASQVGGVIRSFRYANPDDLARYHRPATPYQRLLDDARTPEDTRLCLKATYLTVRLLRDIRLAQERLLCFRSTGPLPLPCAVGSSTDRLGTVYMGDAMNSVKRIGEENLINTVGYGRRKGCKIWSGI